MMLRIFLVILLLSLTGTLSAQQAQRYDYLDPTDRLITAGVQALMICNGLFVSNRTLDQIYEQYAPNRFTTGSARQVQLDDDDKFSLSIQPALSKETASLLEHLLTFYDRLAQQEGQNDQDP